MSRTQWYCLVAVGAVVLGLLCGPATAADTEPVRSTATTVTAPASDGGIPGCDRSRDHDDGEPGLPARSRVPHDQATGLAGWSRPADTGRGPADPLGRVATRGPEPATPGPVELSVLRV